MQMQVWKLGERSGRLVHIALEGDAERVGTLVLQLVALTHMLNLLKALV